MGTNMKRISLFALLLIGSVAYSQISTPLLLTLMGNFPKITTGVDLHGTILPAGPIRVKPRTSKAFTITASSGYKLNVLLVDGAVSDSTTSYTFTSVNRDHTIHATFNSTSKFITAGLNFKTAGSFYLVDR